MMHIAIAGPVATQDIALHLPGDASALPRGYSGAPLLGVLITELLGRGHRVSAVTLSSDLPLTRHGRVTAHSGNFAVTWCPMRPRAWPFNGWRPGRIVDLYAFERRHLREAIADAAPDVVHAHWCYEFALAALASGLPHVVSCHDSPWRVAQAQRGWRHRGYRWLRALMARQALRRARVVSAVSPQLAQDIAPLLRAPATVVPNPVKAAAFALQRELIAGRCRVLMVGNGFGELKNARTAMLAFAQFTQTSAEAAAEAELVLVGHGFAEGEAAQAWWGARGGRLRFAGALSHDAVLAEMAHSDMLLHASLEESFGLVVAEALAIGLPVVAGASSGAVPWVAGEHAWLVDVQDASAIALAMANVLHDTARVAQRASAGRAAMRACFAVEVVADGYEALYRRALNAAPD